MAQRGKSSAETAATGTPAAGGEWDGVITPEMRSALRAKRDELDASFKGVGLALGVDGSTVSKWEEGGIPKCSFRSRKRILRYLRGEYDAEIACSGKPRGNVPAGLDGNSLAVGDGNEYQAKPAVDEGLQKILRDVNYLYRGTKETPALHAAFVRRLNALTREMLGRLAAGPEAKAR